MSDVYWALFGVWGWLAANELECGRRGRFVVATGISLFWAGKALGWIA